MRLRKSRKAAELAELVSPASPVGESPLAKAADGQPLTLRPIHARPELRYTVGVLASPQGGGEGELVKVAWQMAEPRTLVRSEGRIVGRVREAFHWPSAVGTIPAGSAFAGVEWSEDAWPLVKSGRLGPAEIAGVPVEVQGLS
jgi:hypothetical protein